MPRGRARDEQARERILAAAFDLVGTSQSGRVTINAIADAAGVAKQTIYRWWPSRTAVVLDALVEGTMKATRFPDSDDLRADFIEHIDGVVRLFGSPTGSIIREMVGESQSDPAIAAEFRNRFWGPRRDLSLVRLQRGIDLGQIRPDVDREIVLDAIYGPLWLRLMVGHLDLDPGDAGRVVDVVWTGITTDPRPADPERVGPARVDAGPTDTGTGLTEASAAG